MKRSLFVAFFLCFASVIMDFFYFRQENADQIIIYMQYHSVFAGLLRLAIHWVILSSVSISFLFLWGCIPYVGSFLQITVWLLSTLPFRLYYIVVGYVPSSQDLWNLWTTPLDLAAETVFVLLSPRSIFKVCFPILFVLLLLFFIDKKYPRTQGPKDLRSVYVSIAYLL
jgi:hypothetical protein